MNNNVKNTPSILMIRSRGAFGVLDNSMWLLRGHWGEMLFLYALGAAPLAILFLYAIRMTGVEGTFPFVLPLALLFVVKEIFRGALTSYSCKVIEGRPSDPFHCIGSTLKKADALLFLSGLLALTYLLWLGLYSNILLFVLGILLTPLFFGLYAVIMMAFPVSLSAERHYLKGLKTAQSFIFSSFRTFIALVAMCIVIMIVAFFQQFVLIYSLFFFSETILGISLAFLEGTLSLNNPIMKLTVLLMTYFTVDFLCTVFFSFYYYSCTARKTGVDLSVLLQKIKAEGKR